MLMCLYLGLMYKTLGGYTWSALFKEYIEEECSLEPPKSLLIEEVTNEETEKTIVQSAQQFHLALENLKSVKFHVHIHYPHLK